MTNPPMPAMLATRSLAASDQNLPWRPTIDRILDAAVMVIENGGATAMADRVLKNLAKGFGQNGIAAIWRLDCILVSDQDNRLHSAVIRRVGPVGLNLLRVSEVAILSERVAEKGIDGAAFATELERIGKLPFPHSRWIMALAVACAGATFSKTMAGDNGALALCAVAAGIGQLARSQMQAWKFTRANVTFLCALLSGLIATVGLRLGFSQSVPATLIGSMIYTVPGLLLINGFLDLTSERFLFAGVQRLVHAAFLFLILTIAVAIIDALL